MNLNNVKYLVVGAGFFGSTIADLIAEVKKERVVVIEKRSHVGGNSHSEIDKETGIEFHTYGSHIFHTKSKKVWEYINKYCSFNSYRHKVLTQYGNNIYQMPINLSTINAFYGMNLNPVEAEQFIKSETDKENITDPSNLEEKAISLIGRPLYEAFIKGYTVKQWGVDPKELPAYIITRLAVRYNSKIDYFDDPWQGIPIEGYNCVFNNILYNKNIDIYLDTDFFAIKHLIPSDCTIIFSGPIDRFFNYKHGRLGWRTLAFEKEVHKVNDFQGTSVLNYADSEIPYTRIHEFKHFHEERKYPTDKTVIFKEYSRESVSDSDPYYPVNADKDKKKYKLYEEESKKLKNVIFGGRLGSYEYLNMDQSIERAMDIFDEIINL